MDYLRQYSVTHGVPEAQASNVTVYIRAGRLMIGFICHPSVKAVDKRYPMQADRYSALDTAGLAAAGKPARA